MQVLYAHFLGGRDTTWEPKGSKRVVVAKSHSGQTAYRFATLLVLVAFRAPDNLSMGMKGLRIHYGR